VEYLAGTLRHDIAPELAANLEAVYAFICLELTQALTGGPRSHVDHALRAFEPVADAYEQVVKR
jgi:flagellin-specific chaperone FliS